MPESLNTAAIVLIQDSVGWAARCRHASDLFARDLEGTLCAALLGAVFNASLVRGHAGSLQQVRRLLSRPGPARRDA